VQRERENESARKLACEAGGQVVAKKNTQVATDFTSERAYNKHARKGERGRGRERERERKRVKLREIMIERERQRERGGGRERWRKKKRERESARKPGLNA